MGGAFSVYTKKLSTAFWSFNSSTRSGRSLAPQDEEDFSQIIAVAPRLVKSTWRTYFLMIVGVIVCNSIIIRWTALWPPWLTLLLAVFFGLLSFGYILYTKKDNEFEASNERPRSYFDLFGEGAGKFRLFVRDLYLSGVPANAVVAGWLNTQRYWYLIGFAAMLVLPIGFCSAWLGAYYETGSSIALAGAVLALFPILFSNRWGLLAGYSAVTDSAKLLSAKLSFSIQAIEKRSTHKGEPPDVSEMLKSPQTRYTLLMILICFAMMPVIAGYFHLLNWLTGKPGHHVWPLLPILIVHLCLYAWVFFDSEFRADKALDDYHEQISKLKVQVDAWMRAIAAM